MSSDEAIVSLILAGDPAQQREGVESAQGRDSTAVNDALIQQLGRGDLADTWEGATAGMVLWLVARRKLAAAAPKLLELLGRLTPKRHLDVLDGLLDALVALELRGAIPALRALVGNPKLESDDDLLETIAKLHRGAIHGQQGELGPDHERHSPAVERDALERWVQTGRTPDDGQEPTDEAFRFSGPAARRFSVEAARRALDEAVGVRAPRGSAHAVLIHTSYYREIGEGYAREAAGNLVWKTTLKTGTVFRGDGDGWRLIAHHPTTLPSSPFAFEDG
jgi:hypothetical protein